jgi:tRNA dimethylallyltransferase
MVCGPTGTGKTNVAFQLAKKYNGEIISADSRQIYRGMDIGTGKNVPVDSKIQKSKLQIIFKSKAWIVNSYRVDGIPIWMVDIINPDEEFSVAHYQHLSLSVIEDIEKRGKMPIVVGGTGQYIQSILFPIETSYIPPNVQLRKNLEHTDLLQLQKKLREVSPSVLEQMNQSDRMNPRRLIRKIEIGHYLHNTDIKSKSDTDMQCTNACIIGLTAPNSVLYQRIDERVNKRVKQGVLKEIETLLSKGYSWDLPSMNTFGYKEWKVYFQVPVASFQPKEKNELLQTIIKRWKWDEHGYARRQMTWFKKTGGIHWVDIQEVDWEKKLETLVGSWYTTI